LGTIGRKEIKPQDLSIPAQPGLVSYDYAVFIDGNPIAGNIIRYKYGNYPLSEVGPCWRNKVDESTF